ncbi:MAG TPA: UDP-glucose/GDP-mannose dehydrogenase family protein [Terriglobales bacterium]|nr:UDP-glucose/GDP-mannose dehydrogenase family protein [Terriglobales bacterium]
MKLCVIGTGYVGLTTGACLASIGHEVICTDSDSSKIEGLQHGRLPIYEERLPEVIAAAAGSGRLTFSHDGNAAIQAAEVIFICVGTPPDADGKANLAAVEAVARQVAHQARGYRLVVGKSTVPVHTGEQIRRVLTTHSRGQLEFDVASNPEFLREGTGVYDFFHPDRIVVGCDSERATSRLHQIYSPVLEGKFSCGWHAKAAAQCGWKPPAWVATSVASAELIKHASNSFLSMKISYANAIADICELAGADSAEVLRGLGLDRRIGADFLRPGIGFGGFCFPKDLSAFIEMSTELGYDFQLLREVQAINARRIEQFMRKVREELWVLQGKTIGVLGLAFKAGTDDTRLSPAYAVVRELLRLGARLRAYDPQAMPRAHDELPAGVHYCERAEDVAEGAEAVLILTEWPDFRAAKWTEMARRMTRPLVLDGRNLFEPGELEQFGFEYRGIGRRSPVPPHTRPHSATGN